jgi:hypothetical protein
MSHLHSKLLSINQKLQSKFIQKPSSSNSLDSLISQFHLKESNKIEENIRKEKLKKVEQMKEGLEAKLLFVSQSIGELQGNEFSENFKKKTLGLSKKHAKGDPVIEKEKAVLYSEELKRFAELRKRSEHLLKLQSEKVIQKAKELEERDLKLIEEKKLERQQFRKEELEKFRSKRELKTKEIEIIKSSQIASPNFTEKKPLFIKLEEKFKLNYEMPELLKRKEELREKSKFFKPMEHNDIKEHGKWYNSIKEANAQKIQREISLKMIDSQIRSTSVYTNSWALRLMEEDRKAEEEKVMKLEEKRKMLEKKAKYSELVKEIFPMTSRQHKKSGSLEKSKKKKTAESEASISKVWKPHKFSANPMMPQPKPQREGKQILYLEEKRKERAERSTSPENLKKLEEIIQDKVMKGSSTTKDLKKVQLTANRLEELARKKEIFAENKHLTVTSIQKAADVDKLLISSIRAKLHLLENI